MKAVRHIGSGVWHALAETDHLPGYAHTACGLRNIDVTTKRSWRDVPTPEPTCQSYACRYGREGI